MKQFTHKCIKNTCNETYTDEDQDPYYCKSCQEANKAIAAKVDAQHAGAPKEKSMSNLQLHDAAAVNIRGMKLVRTTL